MVYTHCVLVHAAQVRMRIPSSFLCSRRVEGTYPPAWSEPKVVHGWAHLDNLPDIKVYNKTTKHKKMYQSAKALGRSNAYFCAGPWKIQLICHEEGIDVNELQSAYAFSERGSERGDGWNGIKSDGTHVTAAYKFHPRTGIFYWTQDAWRTARPLKVHSSSFNAGQGGRDRFCLKYLSEEGKSLGYHIYKSRWLCTLWCVFTTFPHHFRTRVRLAHNKHILEENT